MTNDDRSGHRITYLTTTQVADAFGVQRQTVARWIREGQLHAIRIQVGSRAIYRVDAREVRAFARRYIERM